MEVTVPLPVGTAKADIRCEIGGSSLRLQVGEQAPLLSGELCGKVFVDGSAWCYEGPEGDDGAPSLTLELAKRPPDNCLWGYVLNVDRELNYEEPQPGQVNFGPRSPPPKKAGETKAW